MNAHPVPFQRPEDDTGLPLWGVPRFSEHCQGFLVDWYCEDGQLSGVTIPTAGETAWIRNNPEGVLDAQAKFITWLATKGNTRHRY